MGQDDDPAILPRGRRIVLRPPTSCKPSFPASVERLLTAKRYIAHNIARPPATVTKAKPYGPPAPQNRWDKWSSLALSAMMVLMPLPGLLGLIERDAWVPVYLMDVLWCSVMIWLMSQAASTVSQSYTAYSAGS
jgi:hypothetical protein